MTFVCGWLTTCAALFKRTTQFRENTMKKNKTEIYDSLEAFTKGLLAHIDALALEKANREGFTGDEVKITIPFTIRFEKVDDSQSKPMSKMPMARIICCKCHGKNSAYSGCYGHCC